MDALLSDSAGTRGRVRWVLAAAAALLVLLLAVLAVLWHRAHAARRALDSRLSSICLDESYRGRPVAELEAALAALGTRSLPLNPEHISIVTLTTYYQSFSCEVDLTTSGVVRLTRVFRITRQEATSAPEWLPGSLFGMYSTLARWSARLTP